MQTVTSELHNLEDEWLLCRPLPSPDSIVSEHPITIFLRSTEADGDKPTIQDGKIKLFA